MSEEETTATIGVDFKVKSIELDGEKYKLSIWVCRNPIWQFTECWLKYRIRLGKSDSGL
jgi:hypothetical protein